MIIGILETALSCRPMGRRHYANEAEHGISIVKCRHAKLNRSELDKYSEPGRLRVTLGITYSTSCFSHGRHVRRDCVTCNYATGHLSRCVHISVFDLPFILNPLLHNFIVHRRISLESNPLLNTSFTQTATLTPHQPQWVVLVWPPAHTSYWAPFHIGFANAYRNFQLLCLVSYVPNPSATMGTFLSIVPKLHLVRGHQFLFLELSLKSCQVIDKSILINFKFVINRKYIIKRWYNIWWHLWGISRKHFSNEMKWMMALDIGALGDKCNMSFVL